MELSFKTIYMQRIDTCRQCPELLKVIATCKQCGCLIPAKAALPSSSCPLNKWPDQAGATA